MRGLLLLPLGAFNFSALVTDLPGSHNLSVLPRFLRAEIVDFHQAPSEERIYPLGVISCISDCLCMEGEVHVESKLTALTYRSPPGRSSQEVFAVARIVLLKADAAPLSWCERRDYGSSSLLANAVFGSAKLYGPDKQQVYLLVHLAVPQENSLVAVHSITRGNRCAYPQAEELKADAPLAELLSSPATLLHLLKANGEPTLSHVPAESIDSWLELLVRALRLDTGVWVEPSGRHAQEWRDTPRGQSVLNGRMELGQSGVEDLHLN